MEITTGAIVTNEVSGTVTYVPLMPQRMSRLSLIWLTIWEILTMLLVICHFCRIRYYPLISTMKKGMNLSQR